MRTLLIINPAAGHGRGERTGDAVAAAASRLWTGLDVVRTTGPGDGAAVARQAAVEGFANVLVLGGDGTMHEVANGLLTAGTASLPAMGAIPIGTGNDFARIVGTNGMRPPEALEALARGGRSRLDVGRAWDEYFINSLGVGLAAEVAFRVNAMSTLKGVAAYLLAVLQTMGSYQPMEITVTTQEGDSVSGECFALEVGNGATSGGGFRLTPDARPDDGLLDFCLIRPVGIWGVISKLPKAMSGTHVNLPEVTMGRSRELTIASKGRSIRAHFDGEVRDPGKESITISVVPSALPVLMATEAGR